MLPGPPCVNILQTLHKHTTIAQDIPLTAYDLKLAADACE